MKNPIQPSKAELENLGYWYGEQLADIKIPKEDAELASSPVDERESPGEPGEPG